MNVTLKLENIREYLLVEPNRCLYTGIEKEVGYNLVNHPDSVGHKHELAEMIVLKDTEGNTRTIWLTGSKVIQCNFNGYLVKC